MQGRIWSVVVVTLAVALLGAPARSQAQGGKGAGEADASGHWRGFWTAPGGWTYEADVQIAAGLSDEITADIRWTLRRAPAARADYQGKTGMSGVEHTKGSFLPGCGVVKMNGYALDDPNGILGMDEYRLVLSDDGMTLGGITSDHGAWDGQIILRRVAK